MTADPTPTDEAAGDEEEHHPRGTLFLMFCFLAVIATMWIWMYGTMVGWWSI